MLDRQMCTRIICREKDMYGRETVPEHLLAIDDDLNELIEIMWEQGWALSGVSNLRMHMGVSYYNVEFVRRLDCRVDGCDYEGSDIQIYCADCTLETCPVGYKKTGIRH